MNKVCINTIFFPVFFSWIILFFLKPIEINVAIYSFVNNCDAQLHSLHPDKIWNGYSWTASISISPTETTFTFFFNLFYFKSNNQIDNNKAISWKQILHAASFQMIVQLFSRNALVPKLKDLWAWLNLWPLLQSKDYRDICACTDELGTVP